MYRGWDFNLRCRTEDSFIIPKYLTRRGVCIGSPRTRKGQERRMGATHAAIFVPRHGSSIGFQSHASP